MTIFALEGDPGNSTPLNGYSEALRSNGVDVDTFGAPGAAGV
jgi:hypothetical protein